MRTESDVPEDVSVVVVVISLVIEVPLLLVPASLLIPMLNPSTPSPGKEKIARDLCCACAKRIGVDPHTEFTAGV